MKKWFKNNIALTINAVIAAIMLLLWFFFAEERDWSELALNMGAGFLATTVTIFVIDRLLEKKHQEDMRPLRLAMYRDIQLFTSRLISLWVEMYEASAEDRTNITIDKLFTKEKMQSIYTGLDLELKAPVMPEMDWFQHIFLEIKDLRKRGEKILERYSAQGSPQLLYIVHYLVNDSVWIDSVTSYWATLRQHDALKKIPRHPLLKCFLGTPTEKDFDTIHQLFRWCREEFNELQDTSIYEIDRCTYMRENSVPSARISDEKMQKYNLLCERYQAEHNGQQRK